MRRDDILGLKKKRGIVKVLVLGTSMSDVKVLLRCLSKNKEYQIIVIGPNCLSDLQYSNNCYKFVNLETSTAHNSPPAI